MRGSVLIVDDEVALATALKQYLTKLGYQVEAAHSAAVARQQMARLFPDVVLMDLRLPDADGAELMTELKREYPDSQFIILTAHGSIRSAAESTRRGALDYLTKPCELVDIDIAIQHALRELSLGAEVKRLRGQRTTPPRAVPAPRPGGGGALLRSPAMQRTLEYAELAAQQDGIVLLLGESGTGKDWFSRYIHARSRRSSGPFFDINCAALPRELAESELFGHEPGAFTGTRGRKRGLLELAENGTLLLNEVGELDLQLQSKLLTFLDTRTFLRVGGEKPTTVNARIFAATNRDLLVEVDKGRFRSDLYYRLNVFPIQVPALRERLDDLPALVEELLVKLQGEMGLPEAPRLGVGVLEALRSYGWPGNIRELRNVLERTLILSGGVELKREHLALQAGGGDWRLVVGFEPGRSLHEVTEQVARQLIGEALRRSRTRQDAARLLGLSRHALAYQMRTLGLEE